MSLIGRCPPGDELVLEVALYLVGLPLLWRVGIGADHGELDELAGHHTERIALPALFRDALVRLILAWVNTASDHFQPVAGFFTGCGKVRAPNSPSARRVGSSWRGSAR